MIKVNNLKMEFGVRTIFDDVSFNIGTRQRIGLVGRNGSGKTTLFKLIIGQITPESGTINIPKNYSIGYVEQHLKFTKSTVLEEGCLGLKPDEKDEVWKVEKILMGLGFTVDQLGMNPDQFSGGYQVRLNLAKVLIAEPGLLLLDEPTNYLDIVSIRWLERFLRNWPGELMVITHDRSFMNSITTHTMMIHRNKVRMIQGDTQKLYEQIATEEEIYEKTRLNDEKKRKETELFISRFRAKARLAGMVQSRVKALDKKEKLETLEKMADLDFLFKYQSFSAKNVMNIRDLSFGYSEDSILINNLSLDIKKDDRICVIGKNGKGKSTLLRLIAEELDPLRGEVKKHSKTEIGYFGQTNIERLHPFNDVETELMNCDPDNNRRNARSVCGAMMFPGDDALKKISVLSGGEKSRVLLGKILLTPVNMLLLDEPTNHLDIESCDSLIAAIDAFDGAAVVVTHNELFLHDLATKLVIFDGDDVRVFDGNYQDFLDQVGWGSEKPIDTKSQEVSSKLSPKELRKARAPIKNKQRKELRPLEERIKAIEKVIHSYEKEIELNNEKMVRASSGEKSLSISEIQISTHQFESKIDVLYEEMEDLLAAHDKLEKHYEKLLAEIV